MLAALLALAASCAWGSSDFLAGVQSRRRSVWSVTAISQPAAVAGAGLVLLVHWEAAPAAIHALAPLLGGVAGGLAAIMYYFALRLGKMSVAAPVIASAALVPALYALARGERPGLLQYVGMGLAIVGIIMISRGESSGVGRTNLRSVLLALGAAVGFGVMLIGLDLGGRHDAFWSVFDARLGSATVIGAFLVARRPPIDAPPQALPVLAAVGLLLAAANTLFTVAASMGFLSVVAVLGSLAPVVTALCARWVLAERLSQSQLIAAALVLGGVVCLAAG